MPVFEDIDYWGQENIDGSVVTYMGAPAIKNALLQWFSAKRGEYLRNPGAGGILDNLTFKTFDGETEMKAKFEILNGLTNEFSPAISIQDIVFNIDGKNRILEISIYYIIPSSGISDNITIFTNTDYSIKKFTFTDIDLINENLLSFFVQQKPSIPEARLLYDHVGNFWKWGKFKLINLTPADPVFEQILMIANGG